MKRLLFILSFAILFLFSSCEILKKDHWIAVQLYLNEKLPQPKYDSLKEVYYLNLKVNETIKLKYFLVPDSDEHIIITAIEFDPDYFELLEFKEPILIFKVKQAGISNITIKTKNNGSGSPAELRISN